MRAMRSATAARASSACLARSPNSWLGLLSVTTTATEVRRSRSSRVMEGLASASTNSASATVRARAPRLRPNTIRIERANATPAAAHTMAAGTRGENEMPKFNASLSLPEPFEQSRNVDLIGLVIAGERIHHNVDAGAEGKFALARLGGNQRQHRL